MADFQMDFKRKLSLPEILEPGALYLARSADSGELIIATSDINGDPQPLRTVTLADVRTMIANGTAAEAVKLKNEVEVYNQEGLAIEGGFTFDGSLGMVQTNFELTTLHETDVNRMVVALVDSKGRVTGGDTLTIEDLPSNIPLENLALIPGQDLNVNAATATALKNARLINGHSFDGSADITLTPSDIGAAPLVNGLVPTEYLPTFVDDIVEVDDYDKLPGRPNADPALGEPAKGKLYVVVTAPETSPDRTTKVYRWSGSAYIQILDGISLSDQAMSLYESRRITIGGAGSDGTWEVLFKGNADVSAPFTLNNTTVTAGDYGFLQVDAKGRLTGMRLLQKSDIPELDYTVVKSAGSIVVKNPAW